MPLKEQALPEPAKQNFPIVGIGASAGGLDAFKEFIINISADSGMAYVLVQHLDPGHNSALTEILSRHTVLPVHEISDAINVAPNNIYILPENKTLRASEGVLKLLPRNRDTKKNLAIDEFFTSLAEVHKSYAIGIVLSGAASDGSAGLMSIKENGGITYAQAPETAEYESMPNHAINTGAVDFILPPADMPAHLLHIRRAYDVNDAYHDQVITNTDHAVFVDILKILQSRTGNDFTNYKQPTIRRRVARRMVLKQANDPQTYLGILRENPEEQDALFDDILICVTSFFRDSTTFDMVTDVVLPELFKSKGSAENMRIWSAGCSTGQEAYSLAICMHEFLSANAHAANVQIFATDLSEKAIIKARAAQYTAQQMQRMPARIVDKYFTRIDGVYHVNKVIRDMCIFAVHNFVKDPPFAKMDLISCRNALIYLNPVLQKKSLTTFHYALRDHGILLLGKSESISAGANLFTALIKNHKIYARKTPAAKPLLEHKKSDRKKATEQPRSIAAPISPDFQKMAFDILITLTPAAVIINENRDIVHFHGDTGPFLKMPTGKPNFNILKMARPEYAFEIQKCILRAQQDPGAKITGTPIFIAEEQMQVIIELLPLSGNDALFQIILFKSQPGIEAVNNGYLSADELALQRIAHFEQELEMLRNDIRRIAEDHEASTAALQSANEQLLSTSEELQSLNEELETSTEELQSNNEELISLNDELMDRQEQLIASRKYAEAIVETIREAWVTLDSNLRVKTANKAFYNFFQLNEAETEGKLITDLGFNEMTSPGLREALLKIIPEKTNIEDFEVIANFQLTGQRTMLLNARQVVNDRHAEPLILVAFDDITELKMSRLVAESEERFRVLADTAPVLLWISNIDKQGTFFNHRWLNFTGKTIEEEIGEGWLQSVHPDDRERVYNRFTTKFDARQEYYDEYRLRRHDGEYRWISVRGVPRYTENKTFLGYVGGSMDIHTQKNFAAALEEQVVQRTRDLQESQSFLQSVLDTTQNLIYIFDFEANKITFINGKALEVTGYSPGEIENSAVDLFTPLIHHDDLPTVLAQRKWLRENSNDNLSTVEFRLKNKDFGWTCQLSHDLVFKRDSNGKALMYLGVCTDISDLKNANDQLLAKNRELQRSNTELASFSSIASHDLKEPLRKIQIFSKLVIAHDRANVSEDSQNFLDRIIVSAYRMQQLIDDLISYSRTSSISKIKFIASDINKLIDEAREDLEEVIAADSAIIEIDELPVLAVLPSQFRQLFLNLISNAIKYRKVSEVPCIKIEGQPATDDELNTFDSKPDQDYYRITVSDNGIGFLPEYSEKIFEPFQRLHDKDEYSGTGIGLAICKKIMLNHNGHIRAESTPGEGSTFYIYTPWVN